MKKKFDVLTASIDDIKKNKDRMKWFLYLELLLGMIYIPLSFLLYLFTGLIFLPITILSIGIVAFILCLFIGVYYDFLTLFIYLKGK